MVAQLVKIDTPEWHETRNQFIGASEVGALFGCSPFLTKFQMWHLKKGNVVAPKLEGERLTWGTRLESIIANGIAEDNGMTINFVGYRQTHPSIPGMAATLDFEILDSEAKTPGCFEIKNKDRSVFYDSWMQEDKTIEAPLDIELQLQHQMMVTGYEFGALGVLVGGNESYLIRRDPHEKVQKAIQERIEQFWETIEKNIEPEPTSHKDLKFAASLYARPEGGKEIDLSGDIDFANLLLSLETLRGSKTETQKILELTQAKIMNRIKDAEMVFCGDKTLTAKLTNRKGFTVEPTSFRQLRIKNR